MGKAKTHTSPEVMQYALDFKSLRDMAYQQAQAGDALEDQARYALANIVGFPEECPEQSRTELDSGYTLRFAENLKRKNMGNAYRTYAVIDGNYILVDDLNKGQFEGKEKLEITPDLAVGYSTHEFGRLHESRDPQYKAIIKKMRDDVSDYCSGRFKALTRAAKEILSAGKKRSRGATKTFDERLKEIFEGANGLSKGVLNASKRGDPTADAKRFSEAKVAFFAVWNHQ